MFPLRRSLPRGRRELLLRAVATGAETSEGGPSTRSRRSLLAGAAMRRRDTMERRGVVPGGRGAVGARAGEPALPPLGVVLLNRAGFGPGAGDLQAFEALGASDAERLQEWVDEQLDPTTIDDSAAEARIAASGYATLGKSLAQLWADHVVPDDLPWQDRIRPIAETTLATFLRAV